ncbi:unnamed protein product [Durusdinium trenchii]|uniref:Uncharacterized protein n=1 Tax=Durusdinium trenchii TaxID=1381693 RepID=A0ABP0QFC0_9DINO
MHLITIDSHRFTTFLGEALLRSCTMPCPFPPPPQLTEGEFIDVVAAAVGVRAYHRASGRPMPKLPELADNQPPLFSRVREICSSGLHWDAEIAWGPRFEGKDVNLDVYKKLGLERNETMAGMSAGQSPNSKWELALTTAYTWFHWSFVAYPPNSNITKISGWNQKISRADMESVASAYTTGIHCVF